VTQYHYHCNINGFFAGGVERLPIASGRRFMTDLLVSSLMVDGGLQVKIFHSGFFKLLSQTLRTLFFI
jgi:hypothetical protein